MFKFTNDMPVKIRQTFSKYCYKNEYGDSTILVKLEDKWTYVVPLSECSCNILHIRDNPDCIENAYEVEYVKDINTDKRFNNFYLDYYGEHTISLNIIFNKNFFTVGDVYSIYKRPYELLEFSEDKLIVKSLVNGGVKEILVNILNTWLDERAFHYGREEQAKIERGRWWNNFFNTICKTEKLNSFTETENLIDKDLADKSIIYTYSAPDRAEMQLVYISDIYSKGNELDIVNIQNNETICISFDEAVNRMKPVVSLNKNKLTYDNIPPIEFESGKLFGKLRNVILMYESEGKAHSASFDYVDNNLFVVSDDRKIYPNMVSEVYKVIINLVKFDWDVYYRLYHAMEKIVESQNKEDE